MLGGWTFFEGKKSPGPGNAKKAQLSNYKKKSAMVWLVYVRSDPTVVKMNVSFLKKQMLISTFGADNRDLFRKGYCMKRNQIRSNLQHLRRNSPLLWKSVLFHVLGFGIFFLKIKGIAFVCPWSISLFRKETFHVRWAISNKGWKDVHQGSLKITFRACDLSHSFAFQKLHFLYKKIIKKGF